MKKEQNNKIQALLKLPLQLTKLISYESLKNQTRQIKKLSHSEKFIL